MFGELSKLFDRNFAVGFFLPVVLFVSVSVLLLGQFVIAIDLSTFEELDYLVSTTVLGLLSWVGGIVLVAINRDLYRFMEGYGTYNPLQWFGGLERNRYQDTFTEHEGLVREYQKAVAAGTPFPDESMQRLATLRIRLAEEFPDRENLLLPTPFGNALRAFETFPHVMYGIDSIVAWGRLLAVLPEQYTEILDSAKANVDFWVNLGLVFILLQIEYVGLVFATGHQLNLWIVGLWIVLGTIAPLRATSSAREWGHFVKSAFDVFAPKLREALGFEQPDDREEEFDQWENYSRALTFRQREDLPELKKQEQPRPEPRHKESILERLFRK